LAVKSPFSVFFSSFSSSKTLFVIFVAPLLFLLLLLQFVKKPPRELFCSSPIIHSRPTNPSPPPFATKTALKRNARFPPRAPDPPPREGEHHDAVVVKVVANTKEEEAFDDEEEKKGTPPGEGTTTATIFFLLNVKRTLNHSKRTLIIKNESHCWSSVALFRAHDDLVK
jgi:hypothetical protein